MKYWGKLTSTKETRVVFAGVNTNRGEGFGSPFGNFECSARHGNHGLVAASRPFRAVGAVAESSQCGFTFREMLAQKGKGERGSACQCIRR